jgi:tryptophanyl-tRNA synthetase
MQCLIPCAIDQDPYFRLVRDNCLRMPRPSPKPALIHSRFLTALQGVGGKMSASNPNSAIFMSDTPARIKVCFPISSMLLALAYPVPRKQKKINQHAFSGGRETLEEHRALGGNPDIDVAYQYLTYFEDDDAKIEKIAEEYRAGTLTTGELKKMCIALLQTYVAGYQTRRKEVTDAVLDSYMKPRKLEWGRSHTVTL